MSGYGGYSWKGRALTRSHIVKQRECFFEQQGSCLDHSWESQYLEKVIISSTCLDHVYDVFSQEEEAKVKGPIHKMVYDEGGEQVGLVLASERMFQGKPLMDERGEVG